MLFTRCPDCDTTFRVTDDALKKANGQVRCGRCASVFNAYAERRDGPDEPATASAPDTPSTATPQSAVRPSVKIAQPPPRANVHREPAPEAPSAPPVAPSAPSPARDETFGSMSLAEVVAQVQIGATDEDDETGELEAQPAAGGDADGISPSQVHQVLEAETADVDASVWALDSPAARPRVGVWATASAAALVLLAAQSLHHFRADLATSAAVGPLVQRTYALLGAPVVPRWDIHQYEILDWVATAEPNTGGKGSLRITARIKNRGPQFQPYPSVHLRLKDRWEEAVGSRVFAPTEYLAAAPRALMAPGETARAELEVVDPGQDAYGFELDVCVEVETHVLSCGSDKVFL